MAIKSNTKRKTSGRKPIEDKKETVILYIRKSKIKEKGGTDKIKKFLYDTLEQ